MGKASGFSQNPIKIAPAVLIPPFTWNARFNCDWKFFYSWLLLDFQ